MRTYDLPHITLPPTGWTELLLPLSVDQVRFSWIRKSYRTKVRRHYGSLFQAFRYSRALRSDGREPVKLYTGKKGKFFFSPALYYLNAWNRLPLRKNQGWKRQLKRKKRKIRNHSDEGWAPETLACLSPFYGQSTLWTQLIDYKQSLFIFSSVGKDKKTTTRVIKGEGGRGCPPRLSRTSRVSLIALTKSEGKEKLLAVYSVDNINTLESKSWKPDVKDAWGVKSRARNCDWYSRLCFAFVIKKIVPNRISLSPNLYRLLSAIFSNNEIWWIARYYELRRLHYTNWRLCFSSWSPKGDQRMFFILSPCVGGGSRNLDLTKEGGRGSLKIC